MTYHMFDVEIAQEYGINAAVILQNLAYWIEKNRANEQNYFDGHYWTYNSNKAFEKLFPYLSAKQIRSTIDKLIEHGLIITGNYNKSAYDRTLWYAITEKGKTILQNGKIHLPPRANGTAPQGEPIPNINTNNNPDSKPNKKKEGTPPAAAPRSRKGDFDNLIKNYVDKLQVDPEEKEKITGLLGEWLKVRKAKRAAMTNAAIELNLNKLNGLAAKSKMNVADYLAEIIRKGWAAFYEIKDYSTGSSRQQPAPNNKKLVQGDLPY